MTASPAPELGSLAEIAASVRSGERSARAVLATSLDRVRELEGKLHCFNEVTDRGRRGRCRRRRPAGTLGSGPGTAGRRTGRPEGQSVHGGNRDDLLVEDPGGVVAALRRDGRAPAPGRRRGCDRQDQPRRVRHGLFDGELRLRSDPEPLGHRARSGRLVGWQRRRRRRGHGSSVLRQRYGRIDPPAGGAVRDRRRQADLRRRRRATGSSPSPARSTRSDPSRPRSRTRRSLLEVIAGHDPMDSTSLDRPAPSLLAALDEGVSGLRVGIVADFLTEELRMRRRGRRPRPRRWPVRGRRWTR